MATSIQAHRLDEAAYRGAEFAQHSRPLKGCNDLLSITRPDLIAEIHREFIRAGADIITTNTFNATTTAMADYALEPAVREINLAAARLARQVADELSTPDRPRFVAGSLGPTNKTASL